MEEHRPKKLLNKSVMPSASNTCPGHLSCYAWAPDLKAGQPQAVPTENADGFEDALVRTDNSLGRFGLAGSPPADDIFRPGQPVAAHGRMVRHVRVPVKSPCLEADTRLPSPGISTANMAQTE